MDISIVEDWKERLRGITDGYSAKDIFNLDEAGLVDRALPDKTTRVNGDDSKGLKQSKERLTVALLVSQTGEFEKPVMIGRHARLRAFKHTINAKSLGVQWYWSKNAWMTSVIFNDVINCSTRT